MTNPGVLIGQYNKERVYAYFRDHVGCTQVECAHFLGLSKAAVGRHIATLRKEWRK